MPVLPSFLALMRALTRAHARMGRGSFLDQQLRQQLLDILNGIPTELRG